MIPELNHIFAEHWKFLLMLGGIVAAVQTMPSPGKDGAPNHWIYRWIFGCLHLITFQWMRLALMMYPQLKGILNGGSNANDSKNG